ncbi:MAG: cytochrome P450 [Acidimicrobiales bacterium]
MRIEQVVMPMVKAVVSRPKLAEQMFRFSRWGNPFSAQRYEYPYPIFEAMRQDGAVLHSKMYQQYYVLGHEEAKEVLASSDVIVSEQRELLHVLNPSKKLRPQAKSFIDHLLLFIDPPDHTRLRRMVSRAFSPRQISRIEDAVDRLAKEMVAEMLATAQRSGGSVNVVDHFTEPLPVNVICELLGVPEERWEWAAEVSGAISLLGNLMSGFDPDYVSSSIEDMRAYFLELADERRANPADDLITELVAVDEDGDRLNDDELVGIVGILMFAGHETTSGLLGNSIIALADNPEQRSFIRANPDRWDNAVEELLRWDTPLQVDPRTSTAEIAVGDSRIKKGSNILVFLGAANRDPDFYDDPNVLRLDRHDPQPVSFGHGMHHCLGHALARMETKVAMRAFVDAFGDYTVDTAQTVWKESVVTRGPINLIVRPGLPAS